MRFALIGRLNVDYSEDAANEASLPIVVASIHRLGSIGTEEAVGELIQLFVERLLDGESAYFAVMELRKSRTLALKEVQRRVALPGSQNVECLGHLTQLLAE